MTAPREKRDIDATREKLDAIGLSYASKALDTLMAEAVSAEMPAHRFLERLLDIVRAGREERRIKTMLKTSKIPTGQTLENFAFAFQSAIERSRIDTLATGSWIRNAEVILLQGPPGVGKSHSLAGLGIRAIQLGFPVQYYRFDELLTAIKADALLPPTRLKGRKYMSGSLLLIDEMGFDAMNRDEAGLFFRLVSYRYARSAMIITTKGAFATGPNCSLAMKSLLLPFLTGFCTGPMCSISRAAHISYRLRDLEELLTKESA